MARQNVGVTAKVALQGGSRLFIATRHRIGDADTSEVLARNKGLQAQRLGCGLQGVLRLTHTAQRPSQSRMALRLGRREGYSPLHLGQGLLILLLVEKDKTQDYMVPVQGVVEG